MVSRRVLSAVVLVAMMLLVAVGPSTAAPATMKLSAVAGFGGRIIRDSPLPLSIVVESTRAERGTLVVSSSSAQGAPWSHSIPVEIPSGGRKVFDLVVRFAHTIEVHFVGPVGTRAHTRATLVMFDGTIVGMVGTPPAALAGLNRDPAGGEVTVAEVRQRSLELGPEILRSLSYLVVDGNAARAWPESQRRTVLDWASMGGNLIVTSSESTGLGWLPKSWRDSLRKAQSGFESAQVGRGLLMVRMEPTAAVEAAVWEGVLTPTARRVVEQGGTPRSGVGLASAFSAGLSNTVRLRWLIYFLILYIVIAGPANYFILSRVGRKELMWITVPVLALIFCGLGYGLSRGNRTELFIRQATVVFATPDARWGRSTAMVSSASGGSRRIGFGGSYAEIVQGDSFGGYGGQPTMASTVATSSGAELAMQTSPFVITVAEGPSRGGSGSIDTSLRLDGVAFKGTMTNRTPYDFSEVLLMMGSERVSLGALKKSESRAVTFAPQPADLGRPSGSSSTSYYSGSYYSGGSYGSSAPRIALPLALAAAADELLGNRRPAGDPIVMGVTADLREPLLLNGTSTRPRGGGAVVSPVKIEIPPGFSGKVPHVAASVQVSNIDTGGANFGGGGPFAQMMMMRTPQIDLMRYREAVFVSRLPAGIDPASVTSAKLWLGTDLQTAFGGGGMQYPPGAFQQPGTTTTATTSAFRAEVFDWANGTWKSFDCNPGSFSTDIPATAVSERGETLIRLTPSLSPTIAIWKLGVEVQVG